MMGKGDESEKYLKICDKLLYIIIDERLEKEARGEEEKEDLLSFFLKIRDENDRPLSRKYLRDTCFNLLLGGKDTQPKSINLLKKFFITKSKNVGLGKLSLGSSTTFLVTREWSKS